MTTTVPQGDRPGSEQGVADVLRQLLAEERARSDQLLEAMTAWQLRARLAEERLVALSGVPAFSQTAAPRPQAAPVSPGVDRPPVPVPPTEQPETDRTAAAIPPAPPGDPVFTRHPLYRGRHYRQLIDDFANEATGAQRQYAVLSTKPERSRRDDIALGLLDAEWAAIGGQDWPAADPRWLAERRARFEYRLEAGPRRARTFGPPTLILIVGIGVAAIVFAVLVVLIVG